MSHTDTASRATARGTADPVADRRKTARRLADEGMSQRAIAARLGVSKDTVRRDLGRDLADGARRSDPPDATAPAPDVPAAGRATPPAPAQITVTLDLADADLARDIATLLSTGQPLDDLVRDAVSLVAQAFETAWDYGDWPRGTAPPLRTPGYVPYTGAGDRSVAP